MRNRDPLLRILLFISSIGIGFAGLLMIFAGRSAVTWAFMHPAQGEISSLFLATLKQMGGLFVMLALILYFVARDPARYAPIFYSFLVGLVILAFTPLLAVYTVDLTGTVYTPAGLWGKAALRLLFVALLFYLRPRSHAEPHPAE